MVDATQSFVPQSPYLARDFYTYQANFGPILPGTSGTANITVEADSDFRLDKLTFIAYDDTEANEATPLLNLTIQDTGSGRYIMNSAVPVGSIFGNGQLPFVLVEPKIFLSRTTINITLGNYSAVTTYYAYLSLIGAKMFRRLM